MTPLGTDRIETHFQPIVDIETASVVAHEALGRPFRDGVAVPPDRFLHEAYSDGTIEQVDGALIGSALHAARGQGLTNAHSLFVNVEPASLAGGRVPRSLDGAHPLVVEITERALTTDTSALLSAAAALRDAGHIIALDDLGAEPASLALLPLLAPEIVKLDMNLIRRRPDRQAATMMTAIAAYAETSGAVVLAEGIETENHLTRARALGATLAQGWHFGRAQVTVEQAPGVSIRPSRPGQHARPAPHEGRARITPFDVVSAAASVRRGDRALLVQVSTLLEDRALAGGDSSVLLATFQAEDNITPATRRRYERVVSHGCLLTAYSVGAPAGLPRPARSVVVDENDPLAAEWDVVLLTADYAAALTARELDPSRHNEGLYEFVLTTDRQLVTSAARALLTR